MVRIEQLESDRLVLRRFRLEDLDDYFDWKKQEEYHNFLPSAPKTKEEYVQSLTEIIEGYDREKNPNLTWAVALKEGDTLIGSVNIGKLSNTHRCCEIGWGLNPQYQKKGYAYEASKRLLEHIFECLQMHKVACCVWEGNKPSHALAQKLGFVVEGIERQARFKNGKFLDATHYGMLETEWKTKK